MEDLYGKKESPLAWDGLCDEVKDAILGGNEYTINKFKEDVHNKIKGDKEDGE